MDHWVGDNFIITVIGTREMAQIREEDDVLCLARVEFEVSVGHRNGGVLQVVRRDLGWR